MVNPVSAEVIAIAGVGVVALLLALLVPLILTLHGRVLAELPATLHGLAERVDRSASKRAFCRLGIAASLTPQAWHREL